MFETLLQLPRIVKLNLSHNDLNVSMILFRIAPLPTFASILRKAIANS